MANFDTTPDDAIWSSYDKLDLESIARTFLTGAGSARRYMQWMLRTGKLEEIGHAYTQDWQHAGVPTWAQIRNSGTDAQETQRVTAPTIQNLGLLCRLMHEGDIRRRP